MADDTPTTILGTSIGTTTFNATKDGSNNLTLQSTPRTNGAEVTTANPLPVAGAVTQADGSNITQGAIADAAYTSGSGSVVSILKGIFSKVAAAITANISQINGVSVAVGHGVAATALRVELPTDGTGIVGLAAGVNNIGTVAVAGGLSSSVTLAAGVANIGTVAIAGGIAASTVTIAAGAATIGALVANQSVNLGQVGGSAVTRGANTAANSIPVAIATDQTLAAAGTFVATGTLASTQSGAWTVDINGGVANAVRGFITSTVSTAATVIASPGVGVILLVDSMEFGNTSTTQAVVTLNDSATSQFIVPGSGGNNLKFNPPLAIASNTALTFLTTPAVTTMLAAAQAHKQ